jgi:hypothetical protein
VGINIDTLGSEAGWIDKRAKQLNKQINGLENE